MRQQEEATMKTKEMKNQLQEDAMYAIASNLRGFRASSLRVRILRVSGDYVWVRTADLLDVGTNLVLDASQVEEESSSFNLRHNGGLVEFSS